MRSPPTRRPSRIYAGNDPLPPVNPLVPFALIVPLFALAKVRSFFAQHAYELYGKGPKMEFLESGVLWLYAGAAVCAAALGVEWWRGRERWGAVPLAFGITASLWGVLLAAWMTFDRTGELYHAGAMHELPFQGHLVLTGVFAALLYLVFEISTRRVRRAVQVRWAILILPIVIFGFERWAKSASTVHQTRVGAGRLVLVEESIQLPDDYYGRLFLDESQHAYAVDEDGLFVGDDASTAKGGFIISNPQAVDCAAAPSAGLRAARVEPNSGYSSPRSHFLCAADTDASWLHCISSDLSRREPRVGSVSVPSWSPVSSVPLAGFDLQVPPYDIGRWTFSIDGDWSGPVLNLVRRDAEVRLEPEAGDENLRT